MAQTKVLCQLTETDVARAIASKDSKTSLAAVAKQGDVTTVDPETGSTYLHYVVGLAETGTEYKYIPMIYQLSNAGIDVNAKDAAGNAAVQLAIKKMLFDTTKALLRVGANIGEPEQDLILKHTKFLAPDFLDLYKRYVGGYWRAVEDNNYFKVNKLVKCWCRVNIQKDGESLIEFAKHNHKDKIVPKLIQNEASIELVHAALAGDVDRMRPLLCNHDVDVNTQDYSYTQVGDLKLKPQTLRDALVTAGMTESVEALDQHGQKSAKLSSNTLSYKSSLSKVCNII